MVSSANEKNNDGSGQKQQHGPSKRGKQTGQRKTGQRNQASNGNVKNPNRKNNNDPKNSRKQHPQGEQTGNNPNVANEGTNNKSNNNNNHQRRNRARKPASKSSDASPDINVTQNKSDQQSKKQGNGNRNGNRRGNNRNHSNNNHNSRGKSNDNIIYPPYWTLEECLVKYNAKELIRGTIRVLPAKDAMAFVPCDRGSQHSDVMLQGPLERNRSLDGDTVFVELLPVEENDDEKDHNDEEKEGGNEQDEQEETAGDVENSESNGNYSEYDEDVVGDTGTQSDGSEWGDEDDDDDGEEEAYWHDDSVQVDLWDPVVPIQRKKGISKKSSSNDPENQQRRGRVVYVVPPRAYTSEINPSVETQASFRKIVGTLKRLQSGTTLLTCSNKSLPQFRLSNQDAKKFMSAPENAIFQARYEYGAWQENHRWPPCSHVEQFGESCNIEDETAALLIENQVDHGEHPPDVLEECQTVVASGEYSNGAESGWRPTPEMYKGRRDYRKQRIFTIDPTTAKDLDDALHITDLGNGQVEIGVHIADVSYFVQPDSLLDLESQRRCTTVYLVDRVIPMLPRPLCEIACSLNENVERLAFSCVWRMNKDGSVVKGHKVWYGRTVIKSCARLDYATAQNIIENKVAHGENEINEELWPTSRRPTGCHTIEEVAADVRLMNVIAQARRRMRFRNGALGLNAVKLTFQLDGDGETPLLCKPYEIRDSNRLVEEYMLLANYLVAQRLITHAGGKACLRNHEPPLVDGLEKVAAVAKEAIGFTVDIESSQGLQRSLSRLAQECSEDDLVLKCVTEMLKLPMKPAQYICAGNMSQHEWAHFALNIPYYTHFTSPIRRYADVIVHRLLQATIDETVQEFEWDEKKIGSICERCNDKKEGSRKAQERSDLVFLALYLKKHPLRGQLGVVLSVGQKTFTVFVPSLGISALVFLEEHKDWIAYKDYTFGKGGDIPDKRIHLTRTAKHKDEQWKEFEVKFFRRVRVTCICSDKAPITVKLQLEGPWKE